MLHLRIPETDLVEIVIPHAEHEHDQVIDDAVTDLEPFPVLRDAHDILTTVWVS